MTGFTLSHSLDIGGSDQEEINDTELHSFYVETLPQGAWFSLDTHLYVDWKDDYAFFRSFSWARCSTRILV